MTAFFHQIRSQLLEPTKKVWSEWIGVFFKTRRSKKSSNELHPLKEGTCTCFFPDFFEKKTNRLYFASGDLPFYFCFFWGSRVTFFFEENHLPHRKGQHETADKPRNFGTSGKRSIRITFNFYRLAGNAPQKSSQSNHIGLISTYFFALDLWLFDGWNDIFLYSSGLKSDDVAW